MMMIKSPKTNRLADGLIKRASSFLNKIELKTMHKDEEGDTECSKTSRKHYVRIHRVF